MSSTAPDAISVVLLLIARIWQAERELAILSVFAQTTVVLIWKWPFLLDFGLCVSSF